MAYRHRYLDGDPLDLPVGKVVCIGRNYLEHIRELNNTVPETPILFMKPATSLTGLDEPIRLPATHPLSGPAGLKRIAGGTETPFITIS